MILLALLLLPAASAQQFQVPTSAQVSIVCPQGQASASGSTFTCPGGVVPQCPSPPGPGPCGLPPGVVFIGDIPLNGAQINTTGVTKTTPYFYGRVVIPLGHDGETFSIAALANGGGGSNAWKQVVLTKTPGDFSNTSSPVFSQGQTATIFGAINVVRPNAVDVVPGGVYYYSVRYQLPFGGPSCQSSSDCDAAVRGYPPS